MNRFRKTDDTTTHQHDRERLSAYLDGVLSPEEQDAVQRHLAGCPDCQWDLATLQQTVEWTRELPTVPVPRVFTIPVKVERERAPRRCWTLLPVLQGATALVALLLFVAVAGDFWLNGFQFARAPMPQTMVETVQVEVQATQVVEQVTEAPAELKAMAATAAAPEATAAPEAAGAREMVVTQEVAGAVAEATPTAVPAPAELPMLAAPPTAAAEEAEATEAAAATMAPAGMGVGGEGGEMTAEAQADQATHAAAQPPSEMQPLTATTQAEPMATMAATASATAGVSVAEGARTAPTVVAEAPAQPEVLSAVREQARAAERYEPGLPWLRVVELGLAVALLLLLAATFLLVLQRRKAR